MTKIFDYDELDEVQRYLIRQREDMEDVLDFINTQGIEGLENVKAELSNLINTNTSREGVLLRKKERIFGSGYEASYMDFDDRITLLEDKLRAKREEIKKLNDSIIVNKKDFTSTMQSIHNATSTLGDLYIKEIDRIVEGLKNVDGSYDMKKVKELLAKDFEHLSEAELAALATVYLELDEKGMEEFLNACMTEPFNWQRVNHAGTGGVSATEYQAGYTGGKKLQAISERVNLLLLGELAVILAYQDDGQLSQEGLDKLYENLNNRKLKGAILDSFIGVKFETLKEDNIKIKLKDGEYLVSYDCLEFDENAKDYLKKVHTKNSFSSTDKNIKNYTQYEIAGYMQSLAGNYEISDTISKTVMNKMINYSVGVTGKYAGEMLLLAGIACPEPISKAGMIAMGIVLAILESTKNQNKKDKLLQEALQSLYRENLIDDFGYRVILKGNTIVGLIPTQKSKERLDLLLENYRNGTIDKISLDGELKTHYDNKKGKFKNDSKTTASEYYGYIADFLGIEGDEEVKHFTSICNRYFIYSENDIKLNTDMMTDGMLSNHEDMAIVYKILSLLGIDEVEK